MRLILGDALAVAGVLTASACTTSTEVGRFDPDDGTPIHQGSDGASAPSGSPDADGPGPTGDGAIGPLDSGASDATGRSALVRIVNALPEGGAIDVCLTNGPNVIGPLLGSAQLAGGVGFARATGYVSVPSGTYDAYAVGGGLPCSTAHIADTQRAVTIVQGAFQTILAFGHAGWSQGTRPRTLSVFVDDVDKSTAANTLKIRFIHAAAEFGAPLDLEWAKGIGNLPQFTVVFDNAPYGGVASSSRLSAPTQAGYAAVSYDAIPSVDTSLRIEGPSPWADPSGSHRRVVQNIQVDNTLGTNFTIVAIGNDDSIRITPQYEPAFIVCVDDDRPIASAATRACQTSSRRF